MKNLLLILVVLIYTSCGNQFDNGKSEKNTLEAFDLGCKDGGSCLPDHSCCIVGKDYNKLIVFDAFDFNNEVIGLQTEIIEAVLAFSECKNTDDMKKHCQKTLSVVQTSQERLNMISCTKDYDNIFKNGAIKLFNFYEKMIDEDYSLLIGQLEIINDEELDYDTRQQAYDIMLEVNKNISTEEESIDEEFEIIQNKFARDNNFILEKNSDLQNKIDDLSN